MPLDLSEEKKQLFVPEGMVLPAGDALVDADETPRMNLPGAKDDWVLSLQGMQESVHGHLGRRKKKKRPSSTCHKTAWQKDGKRMQEFDLPYVPGDDFDF